MGHKVTKVTVVAENPWTKIVKEELEYPGGKKGEYLIVERSIALAIIPIFKVDEKLHTVLVKQHRHPIGKDMLQFPMGGLKTGTEKETHAREELKQETGFDMERFFLLGEYYVDPGLSRQKCVVYVAEGLRGKGEQDLEETERGMTVHSVPVDTLLGMIDSGEICDSWGITQVTLLLRYLEKRT